MSEQTAQEPTMEEILASIRRIISEDDAPAGDAAAAGADADADAAEAEPEIELEAEVEPESEPEPVLGETAEDEVLELTERVETHGDIDAYVPEPAAPAAEPVAAPPPPAPEPVAAAPATEGLVSAVTATAAASAFGQLSASILMPPDGLTLDAVVRDLLRPLLKDWLDTHLAGIVQAAVTEEVERIARTRGR